MNEQELKTRFPRASQSFIDANVELLSTQPERAARSPLERPLQREEKGDGRARLRYVLYRVRLLDPDNAVGATKIITDRLCEVGILPGDSAKHITLEVEQEKVSRKEDEKTVVHIDYPI